MVVCFPSTLAVSALSEAFRTHRVQGYETWQVALSGGCSEGFHLAIKKILQCNMANLCIKHVLYHLNTVLNGNYVTKTVDFLFRYCILDCLKKR